MLASEIAAAVRAMSAAPRRSDRVELRPYRGCVGRGDASVSQFLLLLKPHMLDPTVGADMPAAVDLVLSVLAEWSVEVSGVVVFSNGYVRGHDLIPKTYPTLNLVARNGADALSSLAARRLGGLLAAYGPRPQVEVSGAFEFLRRTSGFTDKALCVVANNMETTKLAAGAYVSLIDYFGALTVVLNAFHPYQLRTLTRVGACAVALECWSPRSFHDLRSGMVGEIHPQTAQAGSLRRSLFNARELIGIRAASPQLNYVHISPGPAEAAHHLVTYFSDPDRQAAITLAQTNVGALLTTAGVRADLGWLAGNPEVVVDGEQIPLFDLSEDSSTTELIATMVAVTA
jgi:hypothetical protein